MSMDGMTTGGSSVTVSDCIDYGNTWYPPVYPVTQWVYSTPYEPSSCIGKAHVFECAHVTHCQCGSVERVMPKPPAKGKAKR
jgi:hypothetical protein